MRLGSLFTGTGMLDHAVSAFFDAEPVCVWVSDVDPGACKILAHRYPTIPNLGDITTTDWSQVEPVDILTGGFPCQDLSAAGKRAGLRPGTRSGLWSHMAYAISQLKPRYVIAENVRGLLSATAHSSVEPCPWCVGGSAGGEPDLRALGAVLADLADLGYDTQWVGLRAADVGAPHGRFRVFIVAADTRVFGLDWRPGVIGIGRGPGFGGQAGNNIGDRNPPPAPQDADSATSGERGVAASQQAQSGRARADLGGRGGALAADAARTAQRGTEPEHLATPAGPTAEPRERARTDWGQFTPAIRRWERVLSRPAPAPTETSSRGSQRLAPAFTEWMMGWPEGWVTEVPGLTRNEQLKACGNGVVPQQAYAALQLLAGVEAVTNV